MYQYSRHSRKIFNLGKVVLGNRETGQWVRISREVYDILDLGIGQGISIDELKLKLYDDEDRDFIDNIYYKLCNLGVLEDGNHKQVFKNKIASFEITHRCNLKCIHCCIDADYVVGEKEDLSTEEVKKIFNKLIKWDTESIMLSGGEPMLRSDFIELLTYLRENYSGKIIVATNGILINDKNVETLAKHSNQIDISVDGVDEESCSIVRGPGVFDKVINNVKLLKSTGFKKITLSMAISYKNEHLEEQFNKLNESLGTIPLVRAFAPVGRGKENSDKFLENGFEKVYISDEFLSDDYDKAFGICPCNAGKREIMVTYSGDLYPCPSFMKSHYKLGNILEVEQLKDVLGKNEEAYKSLDFMNPENYGECKNCKVNLFCWTCPGELEDLKNRKEAFAYRCKKIKPILYKRVWER